MFSNYLNQFGANLPAYQGQLSAGRQPEMSTASRMFESAIGGYDPNRFADIYGKYSGVASGQGPNLQSYMDAVSKRAQNEWQQNVMPGVIEKTRGFGRGSVTPESIARSGSTFYENLAGTMAPHMLQAGNADIQNRLAGMAGMGGVAQQMATIPMNLANQYGNWAGYNQQLAQSGKDREYDEYKRTSMGMMPYMLQFGQPTGGPMRDQYEPNRYGQQVGAGINTALNLFSLMRPYF